jgi:hypothetical protein
MRSRISSILKPIDGIVNFSTPRDNDLVVFYDNEKTTPAKIKQALRKGGFDPTMKPTAPN